MPDKEKDVNASASSTEEQVVNPEEATTQETVETKVEPSVPSEVKEEGQISQPGQRPEINYAMEALRKVNELSESFKQFQQSQTQPQQPQYSKAQLRTFAEQTPDPGQKVWALEEVDRIEKTERQGEMREMFEGYTQKTQGEFKRQQATQFVNQNFPQCFIKDAQGNVMGWDNTSPLTQKIGVYMQNPTITKDPEGIIAAAKMAAFDLGISMTLQNKVNQTAAQLKREQKKTLITTAGVSPIKTETTKAKQIAALVEQYRKTQDPAIFKQLIKLRGLTPIV